MSKNTLNIKENISLADYSTFKIGGPARFFLEVKSQKELQEAEELAKEKKLPIFVLGGGSNVLFSEKGFPGLVIRINFLGKDFPKAPYKIGTKYQIRAGAGEPIRILAAETSKRGLRGLEWAGGIPGTLGGAVRGNAGAFRSEISQSVKNVEIFHESKIKKLTKEECVFGYRTSLFKSIFDKAVIISVELDLEAGEVLESQKQLEGFLRHRQKTQPPEPSVGCIFKNYFFQNPEQIDPRLKALMPENFWEFKKIPAAWLVENANLKGVKIGNAQVSTQHGNFIVNAGGATAQDVIELINKVKETIYNKFGVILEEEVQIVS